jgi:alkanesulfonate monooxygenase SsuD/methylene tetrahydromethanopterin reductase-like flavin-dependent oxidoreductase (luciferase family)
MIQFCCFNPFPWPTIPARPSSWPFPNQHFDAIRAHYLYKEQIDQLVFAEECGFDWVAVGEDHMTAYSLTPNPTLILSILSYVTTRVKLAILGLPLPLLNPIRVAEECAMLDVLSNGRLVAGFIRGVPQNYSAYNVEPNESRARFEEATQLIVQAWTSKETFPWSGTFYNFPAVSLWPQPLQRPHPPLVFSANSKESAIVGARHRAIIGAIHLYNRNALELIKSAIDAYTAQAAVDGWEPSPDRFLIGLPTCVADSDAEAQQRLALALDYQFNVLSGTYNAQKRAIAKTKPGYGLSPVEDHPPTLAERLANHLVLCGSPETVSAQIGFLREHLGVGVISMHFKVGDMADSFVREGMKLFAEHVLPRFRSGAIGAQS